MSLFFLLFFGLTTRFARTAATLITLFGCVTNSVLVIQVAAAWRSFSFKWEQESDWEALGDKWQMNGFKLIWALCFVYFASSAIVCAVGLHGVLKVCIHCRYNSHNFQTHLLIFYRTNALMSAFTGIIPLLTLHSALSQQRRLLMPPFLVRLVQEYVRSFHIIPKSCVICSSWG